MQAGGRRPFPWLAYALVLVAIVVVAALPLISVFFTYLVADAHGCTVNEARVHPCEVLGVDLGGTLYMTGLLGWLMLATVPLGFVAACIWLLVLVIHFIFRPRPAREDAS